MNYFKIIVITCMLYASFLQAAESLDDSLKKIKDEKDKIVSDIYKKELKLVKNECVIDIQKTVYNYTSETSSKDNSEIINNMMVNCLSGYQAVFDCDNKITMSSSEEQKNCISISKNNFIDEFGALSSEEIYKKFSASSDQIVLFINDVSHTDSEKLIKIIQLIVDNH